MTSVSDALRSDLAHLYRRAGFGATPTELDAAVTAGYAATVAALVQPPPASDPGSTGDAARRSFWLHLRPSRLRPRRSARPINRR